MISNAVKGVKFFSGNISFFKEKSIAEKRFYGIL